MVAIRESESAAEALGVHVAKYKMIAFTVSAGLAGLAGSLFAPLSHYVNPDGFTVMESVIILGMLVIGGLGSHLGAIIGGLLIILLPESISFVGDYRVFVYSSFMLLFVVLMPEGIAGMIHFLVNLLRSRFNPRGLAPRLGAGQQ
jgi:ABC-type branched-subunit amino acid transport system permease subunit